MEIETVLLVDDEDDIRRVSCLALQRIGKLTVVEASSGEEALRLALTSNPDVILLDAMMPEMDGPSVLSNLRNDPRTAPIPVIFLTAKAQPSEVEKFLSLGAEGVIRKPFDPLLLSDEVRGIVKEMKR